MIEQIKNDLNNLTKAELIELLANTKKYSDMLEAKIAEPDEFRFNYDKFNTWYVGMNPKSTKPFAGRESNDNNGSLSTETLISNGAYRMNNLRALKASDNIFNNNIIDAIAEQLEPDWKPDFSDLKQEKCSILFNTSKNAYTVLVAYTEVPLGIAIMSLNTAHTIKRMLNEGKVKLYFEGKR